jgi:hypothetical protein
VPAPERLLLQDYRPLQYDLLLGKHHALRPDIARLERGPRATR